MFYVKCQNTVCYKQQLMVLTVVKWPVGNHRLKLNKSNVSYSCNRVKQQKNGLGPKFSRHVPGGNVFLEHNNNKDMGKKGELS